MNRKYSFCTICARGGSKGLPGKNIRPLNGRPLIAHSIDQARKAGIFQAVAVSSDSEEILDVARRNGADCAIKRPAELATDTSGKMPAIIHALQELETRFGIIADFHFDIDATSPLREPEDIRACAKILETTGASAVFSATPAHRSPYFNLVERGEDGRVYLSKSTPEAVKRRQDGPECFDMNASIYGWRRDALKSEQKLFFDDTKLYVMPRERSFDIDDHLDFEIVSMLMKKRKDYD